MSEILPLPRFDEARRHEIVCSDRTALAAVYDEVSHCSRVETCEVDLPNLRLVLRIAGALPRVLDPNARWLDRVQAIARGGR